jgi:hypothetical protein
MIYLLVSKFRSLKFWLLSCWVAPYSQFGTTKTVDNFIGFEVKSFYI